MTLQPPNDVPQVSHAPFCVFNAFFHLRERYHHVFPIILSFLFFYILVYVGCGGRVIHPSPLMNNTEVNKFFSHFPPRHPGSRVKSLPFSLG